MPAYFADGLVKVNGESLIDMDGSAFSFVRILSAWKCWQIGKTEKTMRNI